MPHGRCLTADALRQGKPVRLRLGTSPRRVPAKAGSRGSAFTPLPLAKKNNSGDVLPWFLLQLAAVVSISIDNVSRETFF